MGSHDAAGLAASGKSYVALTYYSSRQEIG